MFLIHLSKWVFVRNVRNHSSRDLLNAIVVAVDLKFAAASSPIAQTSRKRVAARHLSSPETDAAALEDITISFLPVRHSRCHVSHTDQMLSRPVSRYTQS